MGIGDLLDRSRSVLADAAEGVRGQLVELRHNDNPESYIGQLLGLEGDAVEGVHFDLVSFVPDAEDVIGVADTRWAGRLSRGLEMLGMRKVDVDLRQMLFWLGVLAVMMLVAVMTNPTEASFRTHLTELSFRRHLAAIRSTDDHPSDPTTSLPTATVPTSTGHTPHTDDRPDKSPIPSIVTGTDTPPIAPFRFSNHVAISLRTPMLYFRSLFFLSLAITSPIGPPAFLSDPPAAHLGKKGVVARETLVLYVGYLRYWVQIGVIPRKVEWAWKLVTEGSREKGKKRVQVERPGVLELRAMPGKDDASASTSSKGAVPLNPSKSNKLHRKPSNNDLHENLSLPLHSLPSIPIPTQSDSRRPSLVNLLPPPSTASEPADTPTLLALKSDLSRSQDTLLDLKNQLLSHEQTVSDAHANLQSTLDDLRNKRKEDDVERQELKGRTKTFEEQKRQAESARKEAEKRLRAAEAGRDGLLAKIEGAKKEMVDVRAQIAASERALRTVSEEGAKFLVQTREAVEGRKVELERLEEEMVQVEVEQEELGGKVREAEERLRATQESVEAAKKMGPEEEMMMMAAAYEAAAQEGYMYGQTQGTGTGQHTPAHPHSHGGHTPAPHPGGHNTHTANWASQAAAYMAEAGMPLLDQSYTARSTNPTPNPARTLQAADMKRLADLSGFEDFGPGPHPQVSGDGFGQVLGMAASRLNHTTPPAVDYASESDIYGLDPGSPNGGISTSFSANLLPQGLFRSLVGGDVTPIDDEAGSTLSEALNFDPPPMTLPVHSDALPVHDAAHDEHHHSGSEDEDEAEDIWRSPMTEPRLPAEPEHPVLPPPSARSKRFSFSRLLPPTSTPPAAHANPSILSGLPALPGSRRWFSGTNSASAENLHAFPLFQTNGSSDSLGNHASLGLGGDSPFAPSEKEKKQLAAKWGPLSKYRWAAPAGAAESPSGGGGGGGGGLGRSTSMDMGAPHTRGNSAPTPSGSPLPEAGTGTSPGQSWMARHLHVNGSGSPSSHANNVHAKSKSPLIPSPNRDSSDLLAEDELDFHSLMPAANALGSSADSKEDKKSFKFFSLRKSQGGAGSSPGS